MNVLPPDRVRHQYTQSLRATPEVVFPLLCPVREVEWAGGWEPLEVYSTCGVIEPDCVFTTAESDERRAVWVVTRHEPERRRLEMIKVVPDLAATKVEIELRSQGADGCEAEVAYTHTALSEAGRRFVEGFDEAAWERFMRAWEDELNHYLEAGGPLDTTGPRYE